MANRFQILPEQEIMTMEIGGGNLSRAKFSELVGRAKSVPGARWNPNTKLWEYELDPRKAARLISLLDPEMDDATKAWMDSVTEDISPVGELVNRMEDDAELRIPWADKLFPYQRASVKFIMENKTVLVGHEPGLGKTVTAIAAAEEQSIDLGPGPRLVICPATVMGVWERELKQWLPDKPHVLVIDGTEKRRQKLLDEVRPDKSSWVVVNWEKIRLPDMERLRDIEWQVVIADEAHRAKNRKAKQTQAFMKFDAPMKIPMSGTPIINGPDDLWPILAWLRPEQYARNSRAGGYWKFVHQYCDTIEGFKGKTLIVGVKNAEALRFELADKFIRLRKADIDWESYGMKGIPTKFPTDVRTVEMHPKQKKLYEQVEREMLLEIKQAEPEKVQKFLEALGVGAGDDTLRLLIPNAAVRLTRLRQVASSPALLGAPDDSSKFDAAEDIISDMGNEPVVVFTWYKGTAEKFAERLARRRPAIEARVLTGDTPMEERNKMIEDFQEGKFRVLCCTIAAGGVGITLTKASTAIFLERHWTPAMNQQAIDRLHRTGQEYPVTEIVIQSGGTVEVDKVALRNRIKQAMVKEVIGE